MSSIGFISATQIAAGGTTQQQALAGDFNGDHKKDVVTLIQSDNNCNTNTSASYCISVVLSNGNGTFQAPALTAVGSSDPILVGDLNGDGKDDIIQAHPGSTPSTVDTWLSNGDGTFTLGNNYQISTASLQGGTLTDVNGDGMLDLVAVDSQTPGVVWTLQGNGNGTFQAATSVTLAVAAPTNLVFADFNGDGKIDFAGMDNNNQVNVYLGIVGGFQLASAPLTTPDTIYDSCSLATGDLNRDGKAEIVSTNCNDNNITVYLNNGDGTFQPGVYHNSASASGYLPRVYSQAATIADVNGDGKNDILVSNALSSDVTVLLGNGDGTVAVPNVGYAVGENPQTAVVVDDFNGDGLADIIIAGQNQNFCCMSPSQNFAYLQGYGDGSFRSAVNYYAPITDNGGAESLSVATGDFNGDGLADVVIGNCCDSTIGITVFLSRADGSLEPGVNYGSIGQAFVAVGDFNGDHNLDIAATDLFNGGVQIFLGNGDGTFTPGNTFPTDNVSNQSYGVAVGDYNHDGNLDLAVTNGGDVGILLGDGTGNFSAPSTYAISQYGFEITAADLNGDGYLDLLVPMNNYPSNGVAVLLGNSDNTGTFTVKPDVAVGNAPFSVAVGDLDGDGKADLAVSIDDQGTGIAVALGNGDGTFGAAQLFPSSLQDPNWGTPSPTYVKMFDVDGDGKLDVVYSNANYGTIGVMLGQGNGSFNNPVEYASAGYGFGLDLADINGDGAIDVVAVSSNFGAATVLLNNIGSSDTLISSLNPAVASQSITLTATVAASVRGVTAVPTGAVAFSDGSTLLGTAPLSGGVANFTTSSLAVGTHSIIAQYSGSANFHASTSTVLSQVVTATPDYSMAATPASATVKAGSSATFTITLTPSNGYNGTVTFSCGTLPAKAACAFSPASLTPTGNAPVSTTLTITTAAATASFVAPVRPNSKPSAPTFWASLSGLGVFGLVLTGNGKKRNRRQMAIVLGILLLVMMFSLVGCSGGGSSSGGNGGGGTPGTPAGSYTVQLTATGTAGSNSGTTAAHSFSVAVTVQ